VISASKPRWQQMTALVSLSASGTITGFSFVPSAPADLTSPASMPIRLMALERTATTVAPTNDAALRSAIVNVASYYLRMAQNKTPAEMEAIIWQHDSIDGVDHGESCAAFASLTLELGAQVVGQQSWVTGGTSYPWPLHEWADVRVDPNPDSLNITSVLQDAETHGRWHALGDGYVPQPGDWVLFDGHVEVVTKYSGGVLSTIGGDSLPNFSVNAHQYSAPLAAQGVVGFVNNGHLAPTATTSTSAGDGQEQAPAPPSGTAIPGDPAANSPAPAVAQQADTAAIPGLPSATAGQGGRPASQTRPRGHWHAAHDATSPSQTGADTTSAADVPGTAGYGPSGSPATAAAGGSTIPGLPATVQGPGGATSSSIPYRRHRPGASTVPAQATSAQQAFINAIAPGALATQRRFGVPAAVTIAQAIDESGWGQSKLAVNDHNLFGIKGTGPGGSDILPTEEYENGQWVTINSGFRVYHNFAESIEDHGELLATSGYYTQAMADRSEPDAFANALTGVYATNPEYGADLIQLMQQYNLYRYDAGAPAARSAPRPAATARPSRPAPSSPGASTVPAAPPPAPSGPQPSPSSSAPPSGSPSPSPTAPQPTPGSPQPAPTSPDPSATTAGPSPTAAGPSASAPGSATTGTGSWPEPAGPIPADEAGSPSIPGFWPTAPGPSGVAPATSATAPMARSQARPHSADPLRSAPAATTEPTTQSYSYQHLSADMSPIQTTSAFRPAPADDRATMNLRPAAADDRATARSRPAADDPATMNFRAAPADDLATMSLRAAPAHDRPTSSFRRAGAGDQVTTKLGVRKRRPRPASCRQLLPPSVKNAFASQAKVPLVRAELLYREVASRTGIPWQVLAACDWMQCEARPRRSPVHGEKLGAVNLDGSVYRTKSAALEQCAYDLIDLAAGVYRVDLTGTGELSVSELALAFAAFRWGGLLKQHHTSAMEFPYSVAGLTIEHMNMRWPNIDESHTPDRPGARFRRPFGAVPVVLSLNYPAIA
jgi:flagellum-specific peptidoglycan hydrolase FlgJ